MAQENRNENTRNEASDVARLKAVGSLSFSQSGYAPSKTEWELTPDQVIDIVKKQSKAFIDDVDQVTLDVNYHNGRISAFVWIPKNSRHVCNNELRNSNSAINRSMTRYSKEIKEFMDKFCFENEKRIISADEGVPLVGVRVAIERFMKIEFDENGIQYAERYGTKNQRKSIITLTGYYAKGDEGRFGKLQYIVVSKRLKTRFSGYNPKPKRSYNAR